MSLEENKATARRIADLAFSKGDLDVLDEIMSADCEVVGVTGVGRGPGVTLSRTFRWLSRR